ncbi:MAG: hypothetical protein HND56_07520 [Pseudomonadota bacterium]|nr:MAG: hypothetical protein HND56_07520 [Pseudomonadota bacterium]
MSDEKMNLEEQSEHEENTVPSESTPSRKKKWKFYIALAVFAGVSLALAYMSKKFSTPPPSIHHTTLGGGCPTCGLG